MAAIAGGEQPPYPAAPRGPVLEGPAVAGPVLDGTALDGPGLDGPGLDGPVLEGTGLDGTGLDGTALDAPGLDVTGLDGTALRDILLAPGCQPQVAADCEALVDREVAELSGVTGAAVRLAYRTVRAFDAGHIRIMIESLLPDVADALQPWWTGFATDPGAEAGDFGAYLARREDEVAEALIGITDERRKFSHRPTIVKAYNTVRPHAVKHVKAALPAVGRLVQQHAA